MNLDWGYATRFTPRLRWTAQANVRWADATRTRTYFGISDAQSAATGLLPYQPKAGIAGYGVTTTLDYAFGKHWSILGLAKYERLAGDAKDSPIVMARGRTNQLSAGVFSDIGSDAGQEAGRRRTARLDVASGMAGRSRTAHCSEPHLRGACVDGTTWRISC